jgi:hypothetical protein
LREFERQRELERVHENLRVCVCVRERGQERDVSSVFERVRERKREFEREGLRERI